MKIWYLFVALMLACSISVTAQGEETYLTPSEIDSILDRYERTISALPDIKPEEAKLFLDRLAERELQKKRLSERYKKREYVKDLSRSEMARNISEYNNGNPNYVRVRTGDIGQVNGTTLPFELPDRTLPRSEYLRQYANRYAQAYNATRRHDLPTRRLRYLR